MNPPGYWRSLALVRRTFAAAPLPTRLHVVGRFLSCPFLRVLAALPPGARLLDVGAGHGTFSHLAAAWGAARVIAVEPDRRKVFAAPRHPCVEVVAGYLDAVSGAFDAISMLDVLYRVPIAGWDALFATLYDRLAPGGVLLLKDLDPEHRAKALWNRTQERLADRLGMTLGDAFSYESRGEVRARLARAGFEPVEAAEIGAWYPHAHILYVARRPASRPLVR